MQSSKVSHHGFTIIELLVVIAIIGLLASVVLISLNSQRDNARQTRVNADLRQLEVAIEKERIEQSRTLMQITGSGCSDCACRDDADLADPDSACISAMTSGFGSINLQWTEDPWGSPYLWDENEGEFAGNPCRNDTLRSAGPDRAFGGGDDISTSIPFSLPECT